MDSELTAILEVISPQKQSEICTDLFLSATANLMEGSEDYDPFCGGGRSKEWGIIVEERFMNDEGHRFTGLKLWKNRKGDKATNGELIDVLVRNGCLQLAREVASLLATGVTPDVVMEVFKEYLAKYYNVLFPPAIPTHPGQVPLNLKRLYHKEGAPLVTHIQDGDETRHVKLDSFEDIFQSRAVATTKLQDIESDVTSKEFNHLTIVEGVAGTGKSAMCWHMSLLWHEQKLFQEFPLFIFISLHDPAVQSAKTLADVVPHPCEQMRRAVAEQISKNKGDGVALVIDGIDEAPLDPHGLGSPFLEVLIEAVFNWNKAAVLVTSRPCCPQLDFLKSCVESYEMVSMCGLSSSGAGIFALMFGSVYISPGLVSLCQLPFNAGLAGHVCEETTTFRGQSQPTTQTGLVLAFLIIFLKKCTEEDISNEKILELVQTPPQCIDWLLPSTKQAFRDLGQLAMDMKSSGATTILANKKPDSLPEAIFTGFMRGTTSFDYMHAIDSLQQRRYRFPHSIFQDFFIAFSLQYMDPKAVASYLHDEVKQHALSPVLSFYAGLTGLRKLSCLAPLFQHLTPGDSSIPTLLPTLLSAVYETQSREVLQFVLYQISLKHKPSSGPLRLDLSSLPAYVPHMVYDNLAYFLNTVSYDSRLLLVDLANSCIDDEILKSTISSLKAINRLHATRRGSHTVKVMLCLDNNAISHKASGCLFEYMLQQEQGSMVFGFLSLRNIWKNDVSAIHETLKSLLLTVSLTPTLKGLDISGNHICGEHMCHISSMLEGSGNLQCLNLSNNIIGSEISSLVAALSTNSSLCVLSLYQCQLNDTDLRLLGNVLKDNKSLECLDISFNHAITTSGLTEFLVCLVSNDDLRFLYAVSLPLVRQYNIYLEAIICERLRRGVKEELSIQFAPSLDLLENFRLNSCAMVRRNNYQEYLNQVCSLEHLELVVDGIKNPENVIACMGMQISSDSLKTSAIPSGLVAKLTLKKAWMDNDATYSEVVNALYLARENAAINQLYSILTQSFPGIEHMVTACLAESYRQIPFLHRSVVSGIISDSEYNCRLFLSIVNSTSVMIEGSGRKEVKLSHLPEQGEVVLLKGVSGSGKTTLIDCSCLMWALASEHWYRDFKLVIKVPLGDPAIQRATCLADIIPLICNELRTATARYIEERKGKGVVFMLDSADCVPPEALKFSYLTHLLNVSSSHIPLAAVIVATQPEMNNLGPCTISKQALLPSLAEFSKKFILVKAISSKENPTLSSFIMILPQLPEELKNPTIDSLSAIPLYACAIAYLLKYTGDISCVPETRTTVLKWYLNTKIIVFLKNQFPLHTPPKYNHDFHSIEDFIILPKKLYCTLKDACRVAFQTLKDGCGIFGIPEHQDLGISMQVTNDLCSLGILQVTQYDRTKYEFVHSLLQEYLAALHLVSNFQQFDVSLIPQFIFPSFTFPFLSGLVATHIVPMAIQMPLNDSLQTVEASLPSTGYQHRLLAFLRCVSESKSIVWCENIFQQLQTFEPECGLRLRLKENMLLSMSDCMTIRCFYDLCRKKAMNVVIDVRSCEVDKRGLAILSEAAKCSNSASCTCLLLPCEPDRSNKAISWKEISDQVLVMAFTTLLCSKRDENFVLTTINTLLQGLSPDILSRCCSDFHLLGIANEMKEWKPLASSFLKSETEVSLIEKRFETSEHYKFVMLKRWKSENGNSATYNKIIRIFVFHKELHLVSLVKQLLVTKPSRKQAVDFFCQYLKKYYMQMPAPKLCDKSSFKFIEPQLVISCDVDKQYPIPLAEIFNAGQIGASTMNPILSLEGRAGSGKTTLVWFMCQKWGSNEYYSDFQMLLLISTRDPMIHSAKSLPDFIPHPSEHVRNLIAKHIKEKKGEGVAFIVDDWCEISIEAFPAVFELCDSCLEGNALGSATMLIASPPGLCNTGRFASSKVKLRGFDSQQLCSYLSNSPASQLEQTLNSNLPFRALCQLPLYAALASQMLVVLQKYPPPETQTEMLKLLVHAKTSGDVLHFSGDISPIHGFAIEEVGRLASMWVKLVRMTEAPHSIRTLQRLGFVEACKSFNYDYLTQPLDFMFAHSIFKDFVIAYSIYDNHTYAEAAAYVKYLTLPDSGVPFNDNVLQFVSGLSRLRKDTIELLKQVIKTAVSDKCKDYLRKHLLVIVIESIYEARRGYLCQYTLCKILQGLAHKPTIDISNIPEVFSPLTFLAVGHFLTCISSSLTISVNLSNNHLQDDGMSLLTCYITRHTESSEPLESCKPTEVYMCLARNDLTHQGTEKLCELIKHCSFISCVDLHSNWNRNTDTDVALKHIIEAVSTASLRLLDLSANSITPAHIHHLVSIVERCKALGTLYLSGNNLGSEATALVEALTSNSCIHSLSLHNCNINDSFILAFGERVSSYKVLKRLDISQNPAVTFEALLSLVNLLKQSNANIMALYVTCSEAQSQILKKAADEAHLSSLFNCITRAETLQATDEITTRPMGDLVLSVCSDEHILKLSEEIDFQHSLSFLVESEEELSAIKETYPEQARMQRYAALCKWKQLHGENATYLALGGIFKECGETKASDKIFQILCTPSLSLLLDVSAYLRDCYLQSYSCSIVTASADMMINYVPLTLTSSRIHGSLSTCDSVTESDLLQPAQIILIEGIAGSGKSTLAQYIEKRWADGGLYNSYKLIIWVLLGDPEVQSAESLRDLIPFPLQEKKSIIANQLQSSMGEGVAFVFDGLDELPRDSSFILHFLKEFHTYLPEAAMLILSRPGALKRLTSSHRDWNTIDRVYLKGFSRSQVSSYFHKCLQDPDVCKRADSLLSESPALLDLCKIPFYACIIVFLLQFSVTEIPATRTGLLKSYLKYLLLNHIDTRTQWEEPLDILPGDFHCLRDLKPLPVYVNLTQVCKLAFITLQSSKTIFGTEELNQAEISKFSECMGLVQSTGMHIKPLGSEHEHVTQKVQFVHSVVHQFLAGLYLTAVDGDEQRESMTPLIKITPPLFSPAFLAGIVSGGSNEETSFALLHSQLMETHLKHPNPSSDQLLMLLHCVFESQSPAMVKVILRDLHLNEEPSVGIKMGLSGLESSMDKPDFVAVGYFLAKLMTNLSPTIPVMVDLNSSDLNDTNFSAVIGQYCEEPSHKLLLGVRENQVSHVHCINTETTCFCSPTLVWHNLTSSAAERSKKFVIQAKMEHLLNTLSAKCKAEHAILLFFHSDLTRPDLGTSQPVVWKELHDSHR